MTGDKPYRTVEEHVQVITDMHEQLNEPTEPTQMQIDGRFIRKLMLAIGECHYAVNRSAPDAAIDEIRRIIFELKGDPEWHRHFNKMGPRAEWWQAPMRCRHCDEPFFRKVKAQIYCDAHRHLGGSPVKLKADWDINEDGPDYVG